MTKYHIPKDKNSHKGRMMKGLWGMVQNLEAQVSQNIMDKGAIYGQVLSPYMITPL